jgi:hypothetical protein
MTSPIGATRELPAVTKEAVSKLAMGRAFSPLLPVAITSWGEAPGMEKERR